MVTDLDEQMANGVFLLTHRPALDGLFDHVWCQAYMAAQNWRRECRAPRYDEGRSEADRS